MITTFIARVALTLLIVGFTLLLFGNAVYVGKNKTLGGIISGTAVGIILSGFAIGGVSLIAVVWGV